MRLLNTKTLELSYFVDSQVPPYAILSHTWGQEEVLFDDIQKRTGGAKSGFKKLEGCCKKAAGDGFEWVWIDTCCIDKSSSAELTEAINSMYQWYKASVLCYVYLEDILTTKNAPLGQFAGSRWFTRGWTLQELIAPRILEFYTAGWVEIGTKASLSRQISEVTGVPTPILRGEDPSTCVVAHRMSWASKRQTTRVEDIAYCLLGIFGVSMPMLYGEGVKAFQRLQEEIMKQNEDYTLFAWSLHYDCSPALTDPNPGGALAKLWGRQHSKNHRASRSHGRKSRTVFALSDCIPERLRWVGLC
ncbi:HET-domain-containing protein [Mollisia scopiformis]|uniref:HET-domain-containing protein n=1 Tax=Mollisia scopiformis TaxID=149040 RepID=A0A194XU77_MOLSC|nr:HET-domain-containing protein [Mollisia scopiformis]KUJ23763.1 HET-domain-containing protein [Mollisia scopiformis]